MRKFIFFIFLVLFLSFPVFSQSTETSLYSEVMSAYNSGFLPGCVDKATTFEKNYPESTFLPKVLLRKGECYVRMGQPENAVTTIDKVQLQLYVGGDGYAESFYWKGKAKFLSKEFNEAEKCFKTCCSSLQLQNQDKAIKYFYDNSIFYIGKVNYEKKDFENAIRYFEYVANNGKKFIANEYYESLQKLAMCYNNTKDYQKTVDLYDKITELINNSDAGVNFDKRVYQSLGDRAADAKTALGSLEEALKLYHDNKDMLSDFYVRLGLREFENGDFSKAEEYFSEAEKSQSYKNADLIKLYRARMILNVGMRVIGSRKGDTTKTESMEFIENGVALDENEIDESLVQNLSVAKDLLLEIDIKNLDGEYKNFENIYYSSLMKAYFFLANYSDIQKLFEEISGTTELTDDVIYIAALSYYCVANYTKCTEILQNIYTNRKSSVYPKQTELYALCQTNAKDYKSALGAYEILEKDNRLTEKTKIDYAVLLQRAARDEADINNRDSYYKKAYTLAKDLTSAKGLAVAGDSAFSLSDNKAAIQKYNQVLTAKDLTPEIEQDALFFKGFAEHRLWDSKNYSGAEKTLATYQKKYPEASYISYSYFICASEAFAAGDKQIAIQNAEMYIKTAPNEKSRQNALQMLASIYTDYKMYDKAISVYEPYINATNDFAVECMYKTAEIYAKSGDSQKSAEMYYKLSEQYSTSKYAEDALFRSGEVLYLVPDYKNAAEYFEIYTKKYPSGKYADSVLYYIFDSFVQNGDITKAVLNGKSFIQKYPNNTFAYSVLQNLLKIYLSRNEYKDAYDVAKKLQSKNGVNKDAELEKTVAMLEKIVSGGNAEVIKAQTDYENAGGNKTANGRGKGTELAKIYNKSDETKKQAFDLAKELLPLQQKNLTNERDYAAENALIIADYYYDGDKKSDAVENYLLAAEYFRMDNNDDKAASCLYTATECFVHLNKRGDAEATAKLLIQLYPATRYAKAVNNLLK